MRRACRSLPDVAATRSACTTATTPAPPHAAADVHASSRPALPAPPADTAVQVCTPCPAPAARPINNLTNNIVSTLANVNTKCLHCRQSIRGKISKSDAARYSQICGLKCTKSFVDWGFAPYPAGGAYSAPPGPLAVFRGPTSKGRGGKRRGEKKGGEEMGVRVE